MIEFVRIQSFRNIEDISIPCSNTITAFIGNNGSGKTNILEATACLLRGKLFRTHSIYDGIPNHTHWSRIEGRIHGETRSVAIVNAPRKQSKLCVQNTNATIKDFALSYMSIVFSPQDSRLITDGPEYKRSFIDELCTFFHPEYLETKKQYDHIVKERNKALEYPDMLPAYDQLFMQHAENLWSIRTEVLSAFLPEANSYIQSHGLESIMLEYTQKGANDLAGSVEKNRNKDILLKRTSVGPHRDDISVTFQGMPAGNSMSTGQVRLASLLLRIAEMEFLENTTKQKPTLFLDDVFSELDAKNQELLWACIQNKQCFLSNPNLPIIAQDNVLVYTVQEGKISTP